MIKSPAHQAKIADIGDRLQFQHAEFERIRSKRTALTDNLRSLRAAATAAEHEAKEHREALRQLMRETAGRPGKQLRQKSAEQRAAIELSDDYTAIAADVEGEVERMNFEMSVPAEKVIELRRDLLKTFSQCLLAEAISEVAPRLKLAIAIQRQLESREPFNERLRMHFGEADALVNSDLIKAITAATQQIEVDAELPDELRSLLQYADIGEFKPLSPLQRHLITQKLKSKTTSEESV